MEHSKTVQRQLPHHNIMWHFLHNWGNDLIWNLSLRDSTTPKGPRHRRWIYTPFINNCGDELFGNVTVGSSSKSIWDDHWCDHNFVNFDRIDWKLIAVKAYIRQPHWYTLEVKLGRVRALIPSITHITSMFVGVWVGTPITNPYKLKSHHKSCILNVWFGWTTSCT